MGGSKDTFPRDDQEFKGVAGTPKDTMFIFPF